MSFQYINPFVSQQRQLQSYPIVQNYYFANTPNYAQNPYQVSLYNNQNTIYPYNNPNYQPKVSTNYAKVGEVTAPSGEVAHLFELSNGHKVAIMPRKDEATIVKTFINAGSMNETDKHRGVMHLNEHGLFKGSSKLEDGDVFRLTNLMGASTNASTDFAKVDYYITAPFMDEANLAKTIEIQGDMITNPLFDKKAMEAEKGPVCSEISMINDDPTTVGFDKVIRNLFQIQSNSKNLVAGSIDTVQNLTTDDMKYYHQTYYTPQNLSTVVVGDVDVDKTIELIAQNFNVKNTNNKPYIEKLNPIQTSVREDIISPKTNYTSVIMGFEGPKSDNEKDFVILQMINYYLANCSTSELKNSLQKLNGSYDATVQKVGLNKGDSEALVTMLALNPNDEQKGLDAFYDAVQKLQNQPLTDEEMTSIHNFINKNYAINSCDSENLCDTLGACLTNGTFDSFTSYREIAQSITKEDIMNAAKKYFDLNRASIVVIHPKSVSEQDIQRNYLNSKYSFQNIKNQQAITFKGNRKVTTDAVEQYKLPNNTTLAINDTNSDMCVFHWSVNTPPVKPKNPNIPAVLRYIFERGTDYKTQGEVEKIRELNGIDTSVYVNGKSIEITADCLGDKIDKTLDLMNELLYHPNFSERDFEEAKAFVKQDLLAKQKDATSNLLDKLYPGYFPTDSNMLKKIDELKLDDIKEFYNQLLSSGSSAFVATVPKSKNPILAQKVIRKQNNTNVIFKEQATKFAPIFKPEEKASVVYDTDELNQAQIFKSYKFPMSGNIEDEAKFELLNTILGGSPNSRLFSDLREKQNLAYSVSSSIQSFENTGILTFKIQTTTDNPEAGVKSYDNVQKSLEGFKKHARLLQDELITDEELEGAKMRLKQNITGQCQNPMSETSLLAMNILEPYGIKRIDKYYEAIDRITKEDIQKAAKFVFSYNPTVSILASKDTIDSQLTYLKAQGEVQKAS